jgi:hypothetical protein
MVNLSNHTPTLQGVQVFDRFRLTHNVKVTRCLFFFYNFKM